MKFIKSLSLATGLLWCAGLHAELVALQEAIEAHDIEVVVNSSGGGYALVRACASCPVTRLDIDSETAVTVDGAPVKVSRQIEKHWSGGIVIYDIRTRRAVRLGL